QGHTVVRVPGLQELALPLATGGRDTHIERIDLCADRSALPIDLRGHEPGAAPTTVAVLSHSLAVDEVQVCFINADLAKPDALAICHWDAPNGLRVLVETAIDDDKSLLPPVRLRSSLSRPENELLALLLAPG